MLDVVALGELLIDFTASDRSSQGMRLFEQNPGGAPANALAALANLGLKTGLIGKVGKDMHGAFLKQTLADKNISVEGLIEDETVFTTLAFVELSDNGERHFSFARKPGADTCLKPEELNIQLIESAKVFHFGSLSLTDEPSRSATLEAVRLAKKSGAIISYDPNYRAPLWPGADAAEKQMRSVLDMVDIIKISDEETQLMTGESDPEAAADVLLNTGIACVVVTLGKNGAMACTKSCKLKKGAPDVKVVDTTGAGDAFWGGFLYQLVKSAKKPSELNPKDLAFFTQFANAVATLCVQKRGGIPAMPTLTEAETFMKTMEA